MGKILFDKFYTKVEVAEKCIGSISDLDSYDEIIEPSAGAGAFSLKLKKCIAFDIAPEHQSIIKKDFFAINKLHGEHKLFIGNPPFGERSLLAKRFIKHSIALGAETIAFILPDTFSKVKNQGYALFPYEWKLITEIKLGDENFVIGNEEYRVPCSFYVWTKRCSNVDLRKKPLPVPSEFKFLPRNSRDADFVLNGNSGKIKTVDAVTNSKSEHYIKIKKSEEILKYKEIFSKLKYDFKSSCNGGNAWIGQQEIIMAFRTAR